jgi:hypothetical protein
VEDLRRLIEITRSSDVDAAVDSSVSVPWTHVHCIFIYLWICDMVKNVYSCVGVCVLDCVSVYRIVCSLVGAIPQGGTALMWVSHTGHEEAVDYLLSMGASVNKQKVGGVSPQ